MRKNDHDARNWYRSKRIYQESGYWYFNTREGTIEGPFPDKIQASHRLDNYALVMSSRFVPSLELELAPKY